MDYEIALLKSYCYSKENNEWKKVIYLCYYPNNNCICLTNNQIDNPFKIGTHIVDKNNINAEFYFAELSEFTFEYYISRIMKDCIVTEERLISFKSYCCELDEIIDEIFIGKRIKCIEYYNSYENYTKRNIRNALYYKYHEIKE